MKMGMGGTKNQELTAISKEIWQYLLKRKITITAEYLTRVNECRGRQGIQANQGFKGMETKPNNLHEIVSNKGNSRDGSVCFEGITPITPLHILENRPSQSRQACFLGYLWYPGLTNLCMLFPHFTLIRRVLQKVNQDQCLMLIIIPAWSGQPWHGFQGF